MMSINDRLTLKSTQESDFFIVLMSWEASGEPCSAPRPLRVPPPRASLLVFQMLQLHVHGGGVFTEHRGGLRLPFRFPLPPPDRGTWPAGSWCQSWGCRRRTGRSGASPSAPSSTDPSGSRVPPPAAASDASKIPAAAWRSFLTFFYRPPARRQSCECTRRLLGVKSRRD